MTKHHHIKVSAGSRVFDIWNFVFITFLCLTILFPMTYLFLLSFSNPSDVSLTSLIIWPKRIVLSNYKALFAYKFTWTGLQTSLLRVALGTIIELTLCSITAYPLSKKGLPFRGVFTGLMVATMFISGGTIPRYLNIKNLGLIDTIWSLVLANAIPTYSMLIMRNFFMSIPAGLEESAAIDGAGYIKILTRIVIPCSKPIYATVALWSIVGHWNAWIDANMYIRTASLLPLQNILRTIIQAESITSGVSTLSGSQVDTSGVNPETLRAAAVMFTTIPIICTYPFLQKYFVKGILVGSLKG